MTNTDRTNRSGLAPNPSFAEAPGNTVSVVQATPRRNALGRRGGERHFESGEAWAAENLSSFYGSVADTDSGASHEGYQAITAGQANGRTPFNATNAPPSWDAVAPEALSSFAASSTGDPGRAHPYPHLPRPGWNTNIQSPLVGLHRGERQNTTMVSKIAVNPRRRNAADVSDL